MRKVFAAGMAATGLMVLLSMTIGCGGGGGGNAVEAVGEIIVRLVMTDAGKAVAPPDPRLTNWVVVLEASDEGQIQELATDDTGVVKFDRLILGRSYVVTVREREGWTIVQPSEVLTLDAAHKTRNISVSVSRGASEPEPTGEIVVHLSATDADQAVVAPDQRLAGWVVTIENDQGQPTELVTNDRGEARFAELGLGQYAVSVQTKEGWTVEPLVDNGAVVLDDEHKSRTVEVVVNRPTPEPEPIVDPSKSRVECWGSPLSDGSKGTADGVDFVWVYAEAFGPNGEILSFADIESWSVSSSRGAVDTLEGGSVGPPKAIAAWKVRTETAGVATYTVRVTDKNGQTVTLGSAQATWEAVPDPDPDPDPEPLIVPTPESVQVFGRPDVNFEPRAKATGNEKEDFVWVYAEANDSNGVTLDRSAVAEWILEVREVDSFKGGQTEIISLPDNPTPAIAEWQVWTTTPTPPGEPVTYTVKVVDALTGKTITLGSGVVTWEDPL